MNKLTMLMRRLYSLEVVSGKSSVKTIRSSKNNLRGFLQGISNESYHVRTLSSTTVMDWSTISPCHRNLFQGTRHFSSLNSHLRNILASRMGQDAGETDLPQNSDGGKLGDQEIKTDEEKESEVLMVRLKEGLKEAMRSKDQTKKNTIKVELYPSQIRSLLCDFYLFIYDYERYLKAIFSTLFNLVGPG
ncbi:hypothetical protein BY996DRAFT_3429734 [Phakopsora pachyrhizi]|nr:hypothetical protein BY996DRAFT_3429734 [Phakopsora pachyrhizi]